jgi:hypothetical protein
VDLYSVWVKLLDIRTSCRKGAHGAEKRGHFSVVEFCHGVPRIP